MGIKTLIHTKNMARKSKSSSIAVIILSSVSIQQCSSFAPKIHSNRRFTRAPASYTDRQPLLYAKSEGGEETSGDASVTTPIESVLKISKNTKEKNKASYEDQEKIFLWLQKGRRVEAIRDESDDLRNTGNSQSDGAKARALTSGAARFEGRYSASDWAHNAFTLRTSTVLREIRSPILFMTGWATLISIVHRMLLTRRPMWAVHMCISDKPHSLMVSALSLLLVFRTNSAYQRFAEGREINTSLFFILYFLNWISYSTSTFLLTLAYHYFLDRTQNLGTHSHAFERLN